MSKKIASNKKYVQDSVEIEINSDDESSDEELAEEDDDISEMSVMDDTETTEEVSEDLWSSEITLKFIDGKIPFSELAKTMKRAMLTDPKDINKPSRDSDSDNENSDFTFIGKKTKRIKTRSKHNKEASNLLAYINTLFYNQEYKQAMQTCEKLIKQIPSLQEPFNTMGMIYDDLKNPVKAFQYFLIAAYHQPNDDQQWFDLAIRAKEIGNNTEAINCYTLAIKYNPSMLLYHKERLSLIENENNKKMTLYAYQEMLPHLNDQEFSLKISKIIAQSHRHYGNLPAAINVLTKTFLKFPESVSSEEINDLVDMQLKAKKYKEAFKVLKEFTKISLITNSTVDSEEDMENYISSAVSVLLPSEIQVDLLAKLIICLIHLRSLKAVTSLIDVLQLPPLEQTLDLHLDIAEAYMEGGHYSLALPLLEKLKNGNLDDMAIVWFKYADCLNVLGKEDEALDAYEKVYSLTLTNMRARLSLSSLYIKKGNIKKAIEILKQEKYNQDLDPEILFQRVKLLFNEGEYEEFIEEAKTLMGCHSTPLVLPIQYRAILSNHSFKGKSETLKEIEESEKTHLSAIYRPTFSKHSIPDQELWEIYTKLYQIIFERRNFPLLQTCALQMLSTRFLYKKTKLLLMGNWRALYACYKNNNSDYTYLLCKLILAQHKEEPKVWALFNLISFMTKDIRHHKFCTRFVEHNHEHYPARLMLANDSLSLGSFRIAIAEYIDLYRTRTSDQFLPFMIGLTYCQLSNQKFQAKKDSLFFQGLAFLSHYLINRGNCQEAFYNLGRAHHQNGLVTIAVYYYKKALAIGPPVTASPSEYDEYLDLKLEISYNLHLIYLKSGSPEYALSVLCKNPLV